MANDASCVSLNPLLICLTAPISQPLTMNVISSVGFRPVMFQLTMKVPLGSRDRVFCAVVTCIDETIPNSSKALLNISNPIVTCPLQTSEFFTSCHARHCCSFSSPLRSQHVEVVPRALCDTAPIDKHDIVVFIQSTVFAT